jgi:orotate phosphoribosyltransferase
MKQEKVIETFKRTGALLEGHFILSSGLHSSVYLQCAIALQSPAVAAEFGAAIARSFASRGLSPSLRPQSVV